MGRLWTMATALSNLALDMVVVPVNVGAREECGGASQLHAAAMRR